ncbi:prolipoprotein diacylglyceryl transferase [Vibrio parahaemolyticus]|uniref:Phosphatidylglycerol--prolipoprotein diacylglyceryl transferase n=4 Tax=Vibrio parahaemolyticus TaxID=670 RepID=A0A7Y0SL25_VIBPH|nr:prolipoprotein diacylglyceryl transferase [Vibrio parahaemolyticus]NMR82734.1 prolipoprotein diacylglyceryl transferase [Vibrio parahaemolyticus]NMR87730.1 prolipoprotein diacylglyceryl transferase [Vibrio parahaemolyticus]NMR94362.1 prolipoprotein diacylglyceryl transferase [Vibrio parahaemolyticus]NMR96872.1 prolipoprotein diacylglyceryl transferase [Vibrio parahaemolyticus]
MRRYKLFTLGKLNNMEWNIDPVLFSLGPLKIHWYGVLFSLGIVSGFSTMKRIFINEKRPLSELDSLLVTSIIGIIVGARVGHCLFYDPNYYFEHPLKIIAIWEGGLASHGGGLGVLIAALYHAKRHNIGTLWLLDRLAISTTIFAFFVRLANFVNSEILGTSSNLPWAIVFQRVDNIPRHPAQLYESICYLAIFLLLWSIYRKTNVSRFDGAILGIFLTLVFSARFMIEFVKLKQAAYTTDFALTLGQLLSVPFLVVGLSLCLWTMAHRKNSL